MSKEIIIIADYTEEIVLTPEQLSEIFGIEIVLIRDLVAYDILVPSGNAPEEWLFDMAQLKRLRTALRLQRDLELNLAGVALVLHMLEEMEELRAQTALLNQHLLK